MRQWAHAQTSLLQHIDNMVSARQENPTGEHKDVLSALVAGLGPEDGAPKLTKDEVFSNVFAFLLCVQRGSLHRAQAQTLPSERELKARAGHETTANTLTFVVSFLAMYTEVQQKVYEEVEGSNGGMSCVISVLIAELTARLFRHFLPPIHPERHLRDTPPPRHLSVHPQASFARLCPDVQYLVTVRHL